jgi:hypothetical protein
MSTCERGFQKKKRRFLPGIEPASSVVDSSIPHHQIIRKIYCFFQIAAQMQHWQAGTSLYEFHTFLCQCCIWAAKFQFPSETIKPGLEKKYFRKTYLNYNSKQIDDLNGSVGSIADLKPKGPGFKSRISQGFFLM